MTRITRRRSGLYVPRSVVGVDYPTAVLADAPIAYWRLNEASGSTTMTDSSGNGRHGAYTNSPTLGVSGAIPGGSTAATFVRASNQYGEAGHVAAFDLNVALSLECWIKTTQSGVQSTLVGHINGTQGYLGWQMYLAPGGQPGWYMYNGSAVMGSIGTAATACNDGLWHHVVMTYDKVNIRLYVDGLLNSTTANTNTPPTPNDAIRVAIDRSGNAGGGVNDAYGGSLDEVAVYGTALSGARVAAHYAAATSTYASAILADVPDAYWRMNDTVSSAGGTVIDSSGNARNGAYTMFGTSGISGPVTGLLTGDSNGAVDFPGTGITFASIAHAAWMDVSAFTIEALIQPDATATGQIVAHDFTGGGSDLSFRLYVGGSLIRDAASNLYSAGGFSLSVGVIAHLAATYDGATLKCYQNGSLVGSAAVNASLRVSTQNMYIGTLGNGSSERFDGRIDEVAFWGRDIGAARIAAHASFR